MWFHANPHCVTAHCLLVEDHHGCSLDGQYTTNQCRPSYDPSGMPGRGHTGWREGLWWLREVPVRYEFADC